MSGMKLMNKPSNMTVSMPRMPIMVPTLIALKASLLQLNRACRAVRPNGNAWASNAKIRKNPSRTRLIFAPICTRPNIVHVTRLTMLPMAAPNAPSES